MITLEQAHIDGLVAQIPGGVENIQDIYPLGPLQEGVLFHHMLGSKESGDTYILPGLYSLPDRQQADRFIDVVNHVVAQHDVLRTAIFWEDLPKPVQVVLRHSPVIANELDLDTSRDAITQLREHMAPGQLWMDLRRAPLLRLDVAADPHSEQVFVIILLHHIVVDHIGSSVLVQEVEKYLATGSIDTQNSDDSTAKVPYREFIAHTLMLAESADTRPTLNHV